MLKKIDILSSLSESELGEIYTHMKYLEIEQGRVLFKEGDAGKEMYIVVAGSITISVLTNDGQEFEIAEITAGNFFGEMSIFEHAPRSATCYAKDDTALLSLSGDDFYNFMHEYPGASIKIMHTMLTITTQRLQRTGAFLSDMVTWGENARKRAVTDELTGLYNRRFLDDALEERIAEAKLKKKSLSMAMVDLDFFGDLNKEYGQATGDRVILEFVSILRSIFSEQDILARYGGDEFTLILSTTEDKALDLCNRVVQELRTVDILKHLDGKITQITSSIGIASFPIHANTLESLRDKTDQALYNAKEQGRNRAILYGC